MMGHDSRRLVLMRVRGESMLPTLRDGDILVVARRAQVRVGRLVIVELPSTGVARRGMAVKRATRRVSEGWWVERDNPLAGVDSWLVGPISPEKVHGVVLARLWPPRPIRRASE
jgi:phage repressor protein C with HTH and peptisase S24 domain